MEKDELLLVHHNKECIKEFTRRGCEQNELKVRHDTENDTSPRKATSTQYSRDDLRELGHGKEHAKEPRTSAADTLLGIHAKVFSPSVGAEIMENIGSHAHKSPCRKERQTQVPQGQTAAPVPSGTCRKVGTSKNDKGAIKDDRENGEPRALLHPCLSMDGVKVTFKPTKKGGRKLN